MRSKEEIDQQIDKANKHVHNGSTAVHGMTYEEGVAYALGWVIGDSDDKPIED